MKRTRKVFSFQHTLDSLAIQPFKTLRILQLLQYYKVCFAQCKNSLERKFLRRHLHFIQTYLIIPICIYSYTLVYKSHKSQLLLWALSLIKIAGNYKMPIIKINMQEIKTIYMYAMALNACDCAIKLFIISHYKLTHTHRGDERTHS